MFSPSSSDLRAWPFPSCSHGRFGPADDETSFKYPLCALALPVPFSSITPRDLPRATPRDFFFFQMVVALSSPNCPFPHPGVKLYHMIVDRLPSTFYNRPYHSPMILSPFLGFFFFADHLCRPRVGRLRFAISVATLLRMIQCPRRSGACPAGPRSFLFPPPGLSPLARRWPKP